jgi:hypothetical protein
MRSLSEEVNPKECEQMRSARRVILASSIGERLPRNRYSVTLIHPKIKGKRILIR